jgi:hypothetical protein
MKARLLTGGPSTLLLANWLQAKQGWVIDEVIQLTTMRGQIVGQHHAPESFVGNGINDGTYITRVDILTDDVLTDDLDEGT